MPKPPEMGHVSFDPPLEFNSEKFKRTWEILTEMRLTHEVAFHYVGWHEIKALSFPTQNQAMIFKLRF